MHELAVTQGILDVVIDVAKQNGHRRVTLIELVVGELSSIVDDSIQFYFDILSRESLAEGAKLEFRRQPATANCWDCGSQFSVAAPLVSLCPTCGGARLRVSGGQEFYVDSIEIEEIPIEGETENENSSY